MSISPEKRMWQAVVYQAFSDASMEEPASREALTEKRRSDAWIRSNGRDFKEACGLAGMNPDFLSEAYVSGRFDRAALKSAQKN